MRKIREAANGAGGERPAPLKRPTGLGETVYERLLSDLMTLRISPGSRINVDTLARELGVSQTPIREALNRLEEQGLVHKTHNVGFSASPQIDLVRFGEIYDFRLLLEPEAAARTAARITADETAVLLDLSAKIACLPLDGSKGTYSRFAILDAEFHDWILKASGNSLIGEAISRLHTHIHLFRLHYHVRVTSCAIDEHRRLVEAIVAHRADDARAAMRDHIELSRERFVKTFEHPAPDPTH